MKFCFFLILMFCGSIFSFSQNYENTKWTIEPQYEYAGHFKDNLALVKVDDKYGFIDKKGTFVIKPIYSYARDFVNGFAVIGAKMYNKIIWGIIDKSGKIILSPLYPELLDFSEGLIAFKSSLSNKWGFLDETGKTVIRDKFVSVSSFKNGLAHIYDGLSRGFINKNGILICSENYKPDKYFEIKSQYLNETNLKTYTDLDFYPICVENKFVNKWGYGRVCLNEYISSKIENWDKYLASHLKDIGTYEKYLKYHIEQEINKWQQKGEFEPTIKWRERVNETSRKQKIDELTIKYREEYEKNILTYKKLYTELAEEYKRKYNKYRDEYYTLKSHSKKENFKKNNFILMTYDADNQSFMIKSDNNQGDILISVPLEEAPSFKQNWNTIKQTITPTFIPSGDDVVLTSVEVTNGNKKYVYDSHTQAKYAVTDINYNFDPVEISIPEVADVNYTFDPVEVIQSTVVQTSPTVKGLEANNTTIERKSIDATKQSDVDINIPQNTIQKNSNTFVVIIANEDYQRVSDVQYANNDGKLFAEYCQRTLGLP